MGTDIGIHEGLDNDKGKEFESFISCGDAMKIPGVKIQPKVIEPLIKDGIVEPKPEDCDYGWLGIIWNTNSFMDAGIIDQIDDKTEWTEKHVMKLELPYESIIYRYDGNEAVKAWEYARTFDESFAFGTGVLNAAYIGNPFTEDEACARFGLFIDSVRKETGICIDYPYKPKEVKDDDEEEL